MSNPSSPNNRIVKNKFSNERSPKSPKVHKRLFDDSPSINRYMINRTKNRMSNSKKAREDMRIVFHKTDKFESFELKTSFIIPIEITPKRPIIAMKTKIKDKSPNTPQSEVIELHEDENLTKEEKNQSNEHQASTIEKVQKEPLIDEQQNDKEDKLKTEIKEESENIKEKYTEKINDESDRKNDKFDENSMNMSDDFYEKDKTEIKVNLFSDDFTDGYSSDTNENLNDTNPENFNEKNDKKNSDENVIFTNSNTSNDLDENIIFTNSNKSNDLGENFIFTNSNKSNDLIAHKDDILDEKYDIDYELTTSFNKQPLSNNSDSNRNEFMGSSIRSNVHKSGGNINGVLRFSIQWNDIGGWDKNDLDAHCIEPNGNEIMYNNRASPFSRGILDIDVTDPKENEPSCENITWPSLKRMQRGVYRFFVRNYEYRNGKSGFRAEIQIRDIIYSYDYRKELKDKEDVDVAEVTLVKNQFSIKHHLDFHIIK